MYEMKRTVYCSHLGEGSVVKNSLLVDYLQDTSQRHLLSHPVLSPFFERENCVMFLISRQIDIIRRPVLGEEIAVRTWAYELNRSYGFRNTVIYDGKGEPIVKSIAGGAFMNTETGRLMRVPAEIINKVKVYPKLDMEYLSRKISLPEGGPDLTAPAAIRKSDIDMNLHVNNARYFDIADDFVSCPLKARRIEAEYKIPVKQEDRITAAVFNKKDGRTAVSLNDENGRQCCVIEYTF
ncbi:MAG: acyl-ACP thioesterase [Ruminococcus sp.]|nr:acyl-ACP thioesterase [Ruminococcus sp.]